MTRLQMPHPTPTENEFEEAVQAMRLIADSSMIGIFKTQKRRFVWTNAACNSMLGYAENELVGQPTRILYPDDEAYEAFGQALYADEGQGEMARTAAFRRKNGSLGWYITHARRLSASSDELIGLFVDVTPIKELEEALRRNNDQLEMSLTSSGTGTWTLDFKKDRFTIDSRTVAIVGFESEQIEIGMTGWQSMIHPEDLPRVQSLLAAHIGGDSLYLVIDYRIRHQKDGHWVAVVSHGKISRDPSGEPVFGAGILRDVSEVKRFREEGTELLHKIEMLLHDLTGRGALGIHGQTGLAATRRNEASLSNRHREVLALIATGLTSAQIAERLNISHATVLTHRRNLLRKLDLHSVADLTRYAVEHKIVPVQT